MSWRCWLVALWWAHPIFGLIIKLYFPKCQTIFHWEPVPNGFLTLILLSQWFLDLLPNQAWLALTISSQLADLTLCQLQVYSYSRIGITIWDVGYRYQPQRTLTFSGIFISIRSCCNNIHLWGLENNLLNVASLFYTKSRILHFHINIVHCCAVKYPPHTALSQWFLNLHSSPALVWQKIQEPLTSN